MICLYSFAIRRFYVWRTPLAGGRAHNRIAPRSCMLRSCRAERRRGGNQPEPSERRAKTGLYKHMLFLGTKPRLRSVFRRAMKGLFCVTVFFKASRLPLHPKKMRDERLL